MMLPGRLSPAEDLSLHNCRVRRVLTVTSLLIAGFGLFWGVVFSLRGSGLLVMLDFVVVAMAMLTVWLVQRRRTRTASMLLVTVMFTMVCFDALVFDIPTPAAARSMHQFLLPLGVLSCLLFREERPWLRHGAPAACLLAYVVLAASPIGWATPMALPDSLRLQGMWLNHALAMVMVFVVLQVMQADIVERQRIEVELGQAVRRGELVLHFQPQVADGGRIVGAEALVRWMHPQRGMVPPGEFIPLAERSGQMPAVGDWVLAAACAQLVDWASHPRTADLHLSVNVSASQFRQADFVERVLAVVRGTAIDPSRLVLELTESMLVHDVEEVIAKMTALKALGVGFSLDDFGTGFSSLSYLQRLPLDQLKIDQSFVRHMLASDKDAVIVKAVVGMGQSLGLNVIAEGVETPAQCRFLHGIGCHAYQGYLFGRPVAAAEFEALVARGVPSVSGGEFAVRTRGLEAAVS